MTSELVVAATVGTAHRAVDVAGLPDDLRPDPLPDDPAVALLDAAALAALARRAAPTTPAVAPTVPPTAPTVPPPERLPVVPDVVRQVLGRVANQPAILIEALTLIGRAGMRLPTALVPALLDDPRPAVVAAARPVSGEIGGFLIGKNPRWAVPAATDPTDRTAWEEGTTAERVGWLRALRRVDPDAARELLAEGFGRESAPTRIALLEALAERLSPADQGFLLTAVGDRSGAAAAVALDLLTRLPDSPLRRQMRDVAARHLTVGRRLLRTTITLTSPTAPELAPWPITDDLTWTAVLRRVDPTEWTDLFGADLLPLLGADQLQPLRPGLRPAALTFRHSGLARLLITEQIAPRDPKMPPTVDAELWSALTVADATDLLDELLDDRRVRPDQVTAAVTAAPKPWRRRFGRRFAAWLPAVGPANNPAPRPLWELWATATALGDCREAADLARTIAEQAAGDNASTVVTRASQAANLLTLRAVLDETLGGTP